MNDSHPRIFGQREGLIVDGGERSILGDAERVHERARAVPCTPDETRREVTNERVLHEAIDEDFARDASLVPHHSLEAIDLISGAEGSLCSRAASALSR